jgi:hypothetical protein
VNRAVAAGAVQRDVGQQPVLRVRLPLERKPDLAAHAAVRAVTADHMAGTHLDLPAGGVAERDVDGVAALGQAHQLDALLDGAAEFLHAGAQQGFGLLYTCRVPLMHPPCTSRGPAPPGSSAN